MRMLLMWGGGVSVEGVKKSAYVAEQSDKLQLGATLKSASMDPAATCLRQPRDMTVGHGSGLLCTLFMICFVVCR